MLSESPLLVRRKEWDKVVRCKVQKDQIIVALFGTSVKAARIPEFLVDKEGAIFSDPQEAMQRTKDHGMN